jgi:acetyltransferase-like isoleucine patch superfamily enzyme
MLLCRSAAKRAAYLKKHQLLGGIGENCKWGPWLLPLYPELIRLHDNVVVHKTAKLVPHDMLNSFLKRANPDADFGHWEKLGCIEIMDNVYIAMNVVVMPNVRINKNCIISAGSVVTSDVPENSLASGIPAKPTGRFDMFVALRRMGKGQAVKFTNQALEKEIAQAEWKRFDLRHEERKPENK